MKWPIAVAALLSLSLAPPARAAESAKSKGGMQTYLVTTTHTPEQCLAALDEVAAKEPKMLDKIEWGCNSGDHTGYAFVQAKDEHAALEKLPETNRATAKAVPVTKFTRAQLKAIHDKMGK
jgi:hypothetical protein